VKNNKAWANFVFLGLVGGVFHWLWPQRQNFTMEKVIHVNDIFGAMVTWGQSFVAGQIAFLLRGRKRKFQFWCFSAAALFCLGCLQIMDPEFILRDAISELFWSVLVVGGGGFLFVKGWRFRHLYGRLACWMLAVAGLCGVVWFWMHWEKTLWWVTILSEDDYLDAALFLMSAGVLTAICFKERPSWQTIRWFGIGIVMHLVYVCIEMGDGDVFVLNLPLAPQRFWEDLFQFAALCAYLLGLILLRNDIQRKITAACSSRKPNNSAR